MAEYEEIRIAVKEGKGWVQYYLRQNEIHVNADYGDPAIICEPQGQGIGSLVLEELVKKANETDSAAIVFHGPNDWMCKLVTKFSKAKNMQQPLEIRDYTGIIEMSLLLPAKPAKSL